MASSKKGNRSPVYATPPMRRTSAQMILGRSLSSNPTDSGAPLNFDRHRPAPNKRALTHSK